MNTTICAWVVRVQGQTYQWFESPESAWLLLDHFKVQRPPLLADDQETLHDLMMHNTPHVLIARRDGYRLFDCPQNIFCHLPPADAFAHLRRAYQEFADNGFASTFPTRRAA